MTDHFCTNCGNSVSEQAFACMSCGAKPVGHKKFCRQCGVGLNPEQVVCIKCGAAVGGTAPRAIPASGSTSNVGFVWMYLIWLLWGVVSLGNVLLIGISFDLIGMFLLCPVCILVATIIWTNMKDKASLATVHGKNILNANFSYCLYYLVFRVVFCILCSIVSVALHPGETTVLKGLLFHMLNTEPPDIRWIRYMHELFWCVYTLQALFRLALSVLFIVSTIRSAIAAKEGIVKPYLLSIPFLKIQP